MTNALKESDQEILRKLRAVALDRFCEHILFEICHIDAEFAPRNHLKYLDIVAFVPRRDGEIARVINDLRRPKHKPYMS